MPLFLTDHEKQAIRLARQTSPFIDLYWAFLRRAQRRAAEPGLHSATDDGTWWRRAAEHLGCGAMAFAVQPDDELGAWLRSNVLTVVRRPVADWVGPPFRHRQAQPPLGHLETAHLCWAVGATLDLAGGVLTPAEWSETADALRDKGMTLCQRGLAQSTTFIHSRAILNSGVAVAAAVLDDRDTLGSAAAHFADLTDLWQEDGSYGESLEYGDYAALGMAYTAEAVIRRDASLGERIDVTRYARKARWDAASHFYTKPLGGEGWGGVPRPRSVNFNDSSATYRPSADVLLHVAVRAAQVAPTEAGLARWLFDTRYLEALNHGPTDRRSSGFVSDLGFLTLPLWTAAAKPIDPAAAGLGVCEAFGCGDVMLRDAWEGHTVVAVRGGGDPLRSAARLHQDLNSGIVAHRRERLLVDPGHSCHRGVLHRFDVETASHNTCTFTRPGDALPLGQTIVAPRGWDGGNAAPPIDRGGRRLIAATRDAVRVSGNEVAAAYGGVIRRFARFWILCGTHSLFVVDHIVADEPVQTTWHWMLNNRDGALDLKLLPPDRVVVRRGDVGMKLFHLGGGVLSGPTHACVHDAYHPLPAQLGEGRPGSGKLLQWQEAEARTERLAVHAMAMDGVGAVTRWHLRVHHPCVTLELPDASEVWTLRLDSPTDFAVLAEHTGYALRLTADDRDRWGLIESRLHDE